mmetsp:Transcript_19753/g.39497  ORF Transcript_19753/g.39497 Transcript_19753/m.39497 type:complete len:532 (-) Transcript_19753:132-1727(-)|eukprot:CAMPEP_0182464738 /NCGR_PEP_ID=MMETSP1319-20130603/8804_1 /TAXON_ID=172717 /ORGANISM="Bolidomonas pacifica, Strain RCC208" /LENGTH=531 /DNA_ID=CAMNT_0024664397 /DNA_START=37 /DNA_END=1632 /DNA_ORIENTATION=-
MAPRTESSSSLNRSMSRVMSESDFSAGETVNHRDYKVRKSSLIGLINWSHVMSTFSPYFLMVASTLFMAQLAYNYAFLPNPVKSEFFKVMEDAIEEPSIFTAAVKVNAIAVLVVWYFARMDNPVYLLDFATFEPPSSWKVSHEQILQMMKNQNCFNEESLSFMGRILSRSGTGQATAWPPGIVQSLEGKPTDSSIEGSRKEAETVLFDIVAKALKKTNVKAKDIDILVVNCSLFSPTPSLCAMIVSKFGMRGDIQSFNLGGMGCSASLISIDLAKQLLQKRSRGGLALVVSTETITPNLYHGNERGFLLQNTLFRCGGAAMVLSNRYTDGIRASYKLLNTVRVQGTGQDAYNAVFEAQDKTGCRGITLSKEIVKVAGKCMERNLTTLGPHVLPLSEQVPVGLALIGRFACKNLSKLLLAGGFESGAKKLLTAAPKHYVPDFKRAVDHFCIHAGGRAVIDGIEKNLKLELFHTEPSRAALYNYGNTSSSSIWYELQYIQDQQKSNPLKKGHRVMQVAFGSGFKCTSAVWLKL